jgi:hypothetical protein
VLGIKGTFNYLNSINMQFSAFFAAVMALAALFQGAVAAPAEAAARVKFSTKFSSSLS